MRRFLGAFTAVAVLATAGNTVAQTPPEPPANEVTSEITEVTVYADRAQVVREARVNVAAGRRSYSFAHLPGWIDEGSVRVTLGSGTPTTIEDVRVEKVFLAKSNQEAVRDAVNAVQEITDQMGAIDDELAVLASEKIQIESIRAFSMEKLPKDMAFREVKMADFANTVDFVRERLKKNAEARRELQKEKRELAPELAARQKRLGELRARAQLQERVVVVEMSAPRATGTDVKLSYLTPGATWEPVAELRATTGGQKVAVSQFAVITQTTGEDWTGAEIKVSTQSPTATLKLPELEALFLKGGSTLAQAVNSNADTFKMAQSQWSTDNAYYGHGQQDYQSNFQQQLVVQAKMQEVFSTLQQRGTTAHFEGGEQTVRADGRPVRVAIGRADLDAKYRILAAPELSLNAARSVDLENTAGQSLLPGKTSLYVDNAFVGTTELAFVAPGEDFSMFVGVADEIKLARELDKKRSDLKRFGKRTRIQVSYVVTAENLSKQTQTLFLNDRVPVSQMEEIKVSKVRIEPDRDPDSQGLLSWQEHLKPAQKRTYRIEYTLDYPTALLAQVRQNPAMKNRKAAPLYDEIERLEQSL